MSSAHTMPYDHRVERNGTWTVFDTHSGKPAEMGRWQVTNLTEIDAVELTAVFNRNTVGFQTRLHRYAIQGLPKTLQGAGS
ncbi:MAG TPA: hypothetical protein VM468_10625 [Mycoplana sp.]|nr:hypothetical protein [Mycoplana sp.]